MKVNLLELRPEQMREKILTGELAISVHGFGYVGAAVSSAFLDRGCRIIAQDVDEDVVERLKTGRWSSADDRKVNEVIAKGYREGRISATTSYKDSVEASSVHIVTVPVSIRKRKGGARVDLSHMAEACRGLAAHIERGDAISIETTLPPGTTEKVLKAILEKGSGLKAGKDFTLIYSPERIFVGRALEDIELNHPRIVSGFDSRSVDIAATLYSIIAEKGVIRLSSIKAAEAEKVFEGIYRNVNIALANELSDYCALEGLDYREIMDAANSQPYCHLHRPGVGVGGACIPVYPYFILTRTKKLKLTYTAKELNEDRPHAIARKAIREYTSQYGSVKGIKITILGLSFRGDIADNRMSPSIEIARYLSKKCYKITVHDPHRFENTGLPENVEFTNDLDQALKDANIVIAAADHSEYKILTAAYIRTLSSQRLLILDPKNILK